ncbi:MAG TPA: zf-HC2 domain-containing protein [Gemmatimonadales bacterium]|nr:zf-HC2 domain-containing protein [Gemmatimonadales bacterium]
MTTTTHLPPHLVAAYVDRSLAPEGLAEVETHLADCGPCRVEVLEVGRLVTTAPVPRARPRWMGPALAAAAAVLAVVLVRGPRGDAHRAPAAVNRAAPATLSPVGTASQLDRLTWTSVSGADRYRVALFDGEGGLLWEATVADTTVAVPDVVAAGLNGSMHYWSVRARVAPERWTESQLTAFRVEVDAAP